MAETNYNVNYDDERFNQVEADKEQAMTDLEQTYGGMIEESDQYYDRQIEAAQDWADKQSQLQQENTDFAIEQIEQQKEQAHKDYTKEQSGAYVDWQKQSAQHGVNAEQMASSGMTNTGYSESSQVSMYNTYQNRVSAARDTFNRAILNYDNAIQEAKLQNNSILAEIAYQALQTQLELSLQGFQYKNNLILDQANKKIELDNMYYNRYLDVLNQINQEKAFDEQVRQYNQNYELQAKQFDEQIRQFEIEIARLKENDEKQYQLQIQELEMKKAQIEEDKRRWEAEMAFQREQFEWQKSKYGSGSDGDDNYVVEDPSAAPNSPAIPNRQITQGSTSSGGNGNAPARLPGTNFQVQVDDGSGDKSVTERKNPKWLDDIMKSVYRKYGTAQSGKEKAHGKKKA